MATQILLNRHTVRKYDPTHEISREVIDRIIEAVRISPTAYNVQDVSFAVCMNQEKNQAAADAQLQVLDEKFRQLLLARKEKLGVTNVVTCDASAEVIVYHNERGHQELTSLHAGMASMAVCVAASEFGLDTMCHVAMVGEGAEQVYGIPKGSSIIAVAIGKALPDGTVDRGEPKNEYLFIE